MEIAASTSTDDPTFKVVLLGEGAVGKSSILLRFVENKFNANHMSTLQASFATKRVVVDGPIAELNIWDTAGQERFHALGPIYYRDSQGALLVFDITDPKSFDRVKAWVKELQRMLGNSVALFVIGNKTDLASQRNVPETEALEYASSVGAGYCECSAKENVGVNELFDDITKAMLVKSEELAATSRQSTLRRHGSRRSIRIADEPQPAPRKKCC